VTAVTGSRRSLKRGPRPFALFPTESNSTTRLPFAESPIESVAEIVLFEQDREQFEADAKTFLASTVLKDAVNEFLDQPSFGDTRAPKCKRCGDLKAEHKNGRGACTAMKVKVKRSNDKCHAIVTNSSRYRDRSFQPIRLWPLTVLYKRTPAHLIRLHPSYDAK